MMKPIMTLRVAAAAMTASALFAAPAMADKAYRGKDAELAGGPRGYSPPGGEYCDRDARKRDERYSRYEDHWPGPHRGYHDRDAGYSADPYAYKERRARIDAVRQCRAAIADKAWRIGFHDVDFDRDRRVQRVGPAGFNVLFEEVEFEGRRREIKRSVICTIRRGRVENIDWSEPYKGRHAHHGRDRYAWR